MRTRRVVGTVAAAGLLALGGAAQASAAVVTVCPTMETVPVHNPLTGAIDSSNVSFDAVDDAAIWVHPTNPSLSLIINADKSEEGGYNLYNLDGSEQDWQADGRLNNVDIRYNFPLGAEAVALVGFTDRSTKPNRIVFYKVNVATRKLVRVSGGVMTGSALTTARGFAMYHSPTSGKYYAFITDRGNTEQYEIDGSTGSIRLTYVRKLWKPAHSTEGMVADDELGYFYLAEEKDSSATSPVVGHIWKFRADPPANPQEAPTMVASTTNDPSGNGVLVPDIKGLTMYYASGGKGYLIAASQGKVPGKQYSSFGVFDRASGAYKGSFALTGSSCSIDEVAGEDGIDVTNFNLGPAFPNGMFVTGDFNNKDGSVLKRQNNKVVRWDTVAAAFSPALLVDNTWDPRKIGASNVPSDTTPPSVAVSAPASGATLTGQVAFTATASDAGGVSRVDFVVDGLVVATDTTAPYSVTWNTGAYSNGDHTLTAVAVDTSGNSATSAVRGVRVSNVSPPVAGTKIAAIKLSGGAPTLVATSTAGSVSKPAYSHSRSRVAYVGPSGIVVAYANGRGARVLPGTRGGASPAWGVLDRTIVYIKRGVIYSTPMAGGLSRRLVGGTSTWLAASPNGKRLAYQLRQSNGRTDIWIMQSNGTGRRNLTRSVTVSEGQPTWVNNTTVAYARNLSGKWAIFRMAATGGRSVRVTSPTLNCQQPAYSPDAKRLACLTVGRTNRVRVANAGGTGSRVLPIPSSRPTQPTWASNGTVAYTTN
jgi:myo-inositol-hexaphosphate 3-phosphohydrolase